MSPPQVCPNCGSTGAEAYCPSCGQRQKDPRISFRAWLADFLDDQLSLNARLPQTLARLFRRPGALSVDWRSGRRARYTKPFQLYLLASVSFFSMAFFLGLPVRPLTLSRLQPELTEIATSPGELVVTVMATRMQGFLTLGVAFVVPLLALWLRWRYRRNGLYYVDHLVFSLHVHALVLFGLTVAYVLLFLPAPVGWYAGGAVVSTTAVLAYLSFAGAYPRRAGIRAVLGRLWTASGWGAMVLGLALAAAFFFSQMLPAMWNAGKREHAWDLYVQAGNADFKGDTMAARVLGSVALTAFMDVDSTFRQDHDAFHIAEIQLLAGHADRAGAAADSMLQSSPGNPLTLGLAARAALAAQDTDRARGYYGDLLGGWRAGIRNEDGHPATYLRSLVEAHRLLGLVPPDTLVARLDSIM